MSSIIQTRKQKTLINNLSKDKFPSQDAVNELSDKINTLKEELTKLRKQKKNLNKEIQTLQEEKMNDL